MNDSNLTASLPPIPSTLPPAAVSFESSFLSDPPTASPTSTVRLVPLGAVLSRFGDDVVDDDGGETSTVPPVTVGAGLSRFGDDGVDHDDSDEAESGAGAGGSAGKRARRGRREPGPGSFLEAVNIASRGSSSQGISFVA